MSTGFGTIRGSHFIFETSEHISISALRYGRGKNGMIYLPIHAEETRTASTTCSRQLPSACGLAASRCHSIFSEVQSLSVRTVHKDLSRGCGAS